MISFYRKCSWFTLIACVGVILWGAYVRASGSGAGCGSHWPLCNGQVLPETEQHKTFVEFSHRVSSGLLLLLVLGLFALTLRVFPRGSFQRRVAWLALVAIILEALVGAFLVLLRLVEQDQSVLRVISISLHLVNTLFLLGTLACLAFSGGAPRPRWRWPEPATAWWPRSLLIGFALLGAFGAIAALGDTLFPPTSVYAGILADLAGGGHIAERIRVLHPLGAVCWVLALAWWLAGLWQRFPHLLGIGRWVLGLAIANLALGLMNVLMLAPVSMQILHLLVADSLWIVFIGLLFSAASRWQ